MEIVSDALPLFTFSATSGRSSRRPGRGPFISPSGRQSGLETGFRDFLVIPLQSSPYLPPLLAFCTPSSFLF